MRATCEKKTILGFPAKFCTNRLRSEILLSFDEFALFFSRIARPDMRSAQDRSSRLSDGRSDRRDATQPRSLASINTSAYAHNQERSYNPSYNPGR